MILPTIAVGGARQHLARHAHQLSATQARGCKVRVCLEPCSEFTPARSRLLKLSPCPTMNGHVRSNPGRGSPDSAKSVEVGRQMHDIGRNAAQPHSSKCISHLKFVSGRRWRAIWCFRHLPSQCRRCFLKSLFGVCVSEFAGRPPLTHGGPWSRKDLVLLRTALPHAWPVLSCIGSRMGAHRITETPAP